MISTLLKAAAAIGVTLVLLYVVVVVLAWKYQDRMAFPAPRSALPAPATLGIPDGERVMVTAADGVELHGWYLPPRPRPPAGKLAGGLVWFYGNMETIEGIAPILRALRPPTIGVLALDYRGYGSSGGEPTEGGIYLDAEAAWDFLRSRPEIDSTRIAVYGRSIGSAVALYLATEHSVRAVVLDSPFTSGREMAEEHYPFLPTSLIRLSLDNLNRASRLTVPLLVFHGTEDRIAPIRMGRAVAAAGHAEDLVEIEGAGHNDTYTVGGVEYVRRFHEFLDRALN